MNRSDAYNIFAHCRIDPTADFFTLSASEVDCLLAEADHAKYRKPRNANGSRGRYFHAMLQRHVNRKLGFWGR